MSMGDVCIYRRNKSPNSEEHELPLAKARTVLFFSRIQKSERDLALGVEACGEKLSLERHWQTFALLQWEHLMRFIYQSVTFLEQLSTYCNSHFMQIKHSR